MSEADMRNLQLDVLDLFDRLCQDLQLTWFLAFGTLLGAVRHQGFIPWDDDVDVMMPRADFDLLCRHFRDGADQGLALGAPGTPVHWPFAWAKLWDIRTRVVEDAELDFASGVGIDIFPIDSLPDNPTKRRAQLLASRACHLVEAAKSVRVRREHRLRGWLLLFVKPLLRLVRQGWLATARDHIARARSVPSAYSGILVCTAPFGLKSEYLAPGARLPFEGRSAPAPMGWDALLTAYYGDYLTPPPPSRRVTHHARRASWVGVEDR
jgi:lipopolysaccharide cholinephosphotransferase